MYPNLYLLYKQGPCHHAVPHVFPPKFFFYIFLKNFPFACLFFLVCPRVFFQGFLLFPPQFWRFVATCGPMLFSMVFCFSQKNCVSSHPSFLSFGFAFWRSTFSPNHLHRHLAFPSDVGFSYIVSRFCASFLVALVGWPFCSCSFSLFFSFWLLLHCIWVFKSFYGISVF